MAASEPGLESAERAGGMNRPSFVLARLGLAVDARLRAAMAMTGLKPRQCLALMHLTDAGRMSQLDLARALGVDPSVLVSILNELERRDLAVRRREPSDRRRHVVSLTERGRAVADEIDQAVTMVEHDLFASLSPAGRARLDGLLRKLAATQDTVECAED